MKDFRDRFIRESSKEAEQPQRPQSYIGPSNPAHEQVTRQEAPPARPERIEKPAARSGFLPVPSGKAKGVAQSVVVNRALVSVWGDRSFLAERLGTVQQGELLTIVEDDDDWMHIRCGTRLAGWVRSAELTPYHDPYAGLGERDDLI